MERRVGTAGGDGTSDGYCREQDTCVVPRRDMRVRVEN